MSTGLAGFLSGLIADTFLPGGADSPPGVSIGMMLHQVKFIDTLWWRCHRRLIAELLAARGHDVVHLLRPGRSERHRRHARPITVTDGCTCAATRLREEASTGVFR